MYVALKQVTNTAWKPNKNDSSDTGSMNLPANRCYCSFSITGAYVLKHCCGREQINIPHESIMFYVFALCNKFPSTLHSRLLHVLLFASDSFFIHSSRQRVEHVLGWRKTKNSVWWEEESSFSEYKAGVSTKKSKTVMRYISRAPIGCPCGNNVCIENVLKFQVRSGVLSNRFP